MIAGKTFVKNEFINQLKHNIMEAIWGVLNERNQVVYESDDLSLCEEFRDENEPSNDFWIIINGDELS